MKNRSVFSKIIVLIILSVLCVALTLFAAFFVGSIDSTLFDFKNLNFSNMIPVLLIGGFITFVIITISVLFVSKSVFLKVKNYIFENKGDKEK